MGKFNLLFRLKPVWNLVKIKNSSRGFTLIELLVVIAMLGIMISFLLIFINPFTQIEKARDAQRVQNLKQVNNALDTYYNDNNRYPSSFSFEGTWQAGSTVYMQKVPQDPSCNVGGSCYTYITDPSNPQWNVLFTKIYQSSVNASTCALAPDCRPSNYDQSGYNYCVLSGEVDCAFISSSITLPANAGGTGGSATPCVKNYSCTGSPLRCNAILPAGSGQYCASNCSGICP